MFSIIIPCQKPTDYLTECLEKIKQLSFSDYEIIVLPDEYIYHEGVKVIPTGKVKPGKKRNIGAKEAQGNILAFIDDDAYPKNDWLANSLKYFKNPETIAVGGPGVTPKQDNFWAQVSGAIYLSWLSGGNPKRFWPIKPARHSLGEGGIQEIDDWPSMNFLVRRDSFLQSGGFEENHWPGEDTKLCLSLLTPFRGGKQKILYAPDVIVYHHRRTSILKHLKQAGAYGCTRGRFARIYPDNSFKFKYFLPSYFFLFVMFGWLILFLPNSFPYFYFWLWIIYFLAVLAAMVQIFIRTKKLWLAIASPLYILPTHFWYGFRFIVGFLKKNHYIIEN